MLSEKYNNTDKFYSRQCLDTSNCNINLDDINPNKKEIKMVRLRKELLGEELFRDSLRGDPIKENILNLKIKEFLIKNNKPDDSDTIEKMKYLLQFKEKKIKIKFVLYTSV